MVYWLSWDWIQLLFRWDSPPAQQASVAAPMVWVWVCVALRGISVFVPTCVPALCVCRSPQRREGEVPIGRPGSGSQAPSSEHRISNLWQPLAACPAVWGPVAGVNFLRQTSAGRNWHVPSFRWDDNENSSLGLPENTYVNPGSIDWPFLTEIQTAFVIFIPHGTDQLLGWKTVIFTSDGQSPWPLVLCEH